MHLDLIETPAVIIDLDVLEENVTDMAHRCRVRGVGLRPHIKTHKIPAIMEMQLCGGALGITVANPGEAETMMDAGARDVLIARVIMDPHKLERAVSLLDRGRVIFVVDSVESAGALSNTARSYGMVAEYLIEVDTGYHRCGVSSPESAVDLAKKLSGFPRIQLKGVMSFPGHVHSGETIAEKEKIAKADLAFLAETKVQLDQNGLCTEIVSTGSTPMANLDIDFSPATELRCGTYVFNDRMLVTAGTATLDRCALRVLATVISSNGKDRAVIDAGSKVFSSDTAGAGPEAAGYGLILESPDSIIEKLNEEHGFVVTAPAARLKPGQRVSIIPNHVCVVVNLTNKVYALRENKLEALWQVAARGSI